ncbi:DEKNAAC103115 [Brettanomyces naardenensis]|uniref:rRNA-processing protein EFG1 n=1 Tax=Brettanomyces naardenensis TaxID=13370 RepID=A0A448YMC6_BRENA|nr:DEKNAAC103115 [Brettanomyces naardenensis]
MARPGDSNMTPVVDLSTVLNKGSSRIKKKIRDIKRLLKRGNLPSDVVIANERALKTLDRELENVQLNQKAKKIHSRYHKVRFFEKKKASRHYKGSSKRLEELNKQREELVDATTKSEELEELDKQIKKQKKIVRQSEIDLAYVLNYPSTEKYISLYPNEGEELEVEKSNPKFQKGLKRSKERRSYFKKLFSDQLKEGKLRVGLEEGLREGERVHVEGQRAIDADERGEKKPEQKDEFFE